MAKKVRKKRETQRLAQILEGAASLFCQKGYHETTLKDIAHKIGLSAGNIYYYVKTKEEILYLLHNRLGEINDAAHVEILGRARSPLEKLVEMIKSEFSVMRKYEPLVMLMYQESHVLGSNFIRTLLTRERSHISFFEQVLEEGVREGIFRRCNVRLLSNQIKVLLDGYILKRWDLRNAVSPEEYLGNMIAMILGNITAKGQEALSVARGLPALSDRVAVITRATTKLGKEILRGLGTDGFVLVAQDDEEENLISFCTELQSAGLKVTPVAGGNSKGGASNDLIRSINQEFERIDVYIHILGNLNLESSKEGIRAWDFSLANCLNKASPILRQAADVMKTQGGGKIILIAEMAEEERANGYLFRAIEGIIQVFTKALASDLFGSGVTVNAILASGLVRTETEFTRDFTGGEGERCQFGGEENLEDTAKVVRFVSSSEIESLTGQLISVYSNRV